MALEAIVRNEQMKRTMKLSFGTGFVTFKEGDNNPVRISPVSDSTMWELFDMAREADYTAEMVA
tara:strand:- start:631 stop:822 length:192 start_codon:yes stop_codon:yes gene_type:complete